MLQELDQVIDETRKERHQNKIIGKMLSQISLNEGREKTTQYLINE